LKKFFYGLKKKGSKNHDKTSLKNQGFWRGPILTANTGGFFQKSQKRAQKALRGFFAFLESLGVLANVLATAFY